MRRVRNLFVGVGLMAVGLVGLCVPVMPGWVFFFAGLFFLAPQFEPPIRFFVERRLLGRDFLGWSEWKRLGVEAGFTARAFPVFLKKTEDLERPENQERLRQALKAPAGVKFAFLSQVHGDHIVSLDKGLRPHFNKKGFAFFPEADGIITDIPHLSLVVLSADCLPIFLCAARKRKRARRRAEWVGILHAGWRGTQREMAKKAVKLLSEKAGVSPKRIRASFGPAICGKHYGVGPEFAQHFSGSSLKNRGGKFYFGLAAENRRQLIEAGVLPRHIIESRICTVGLNGDFYSHRKEKNGAGRTVSLIMLK